MDKPPPDIAKAMLQAAMKPYCTDVRELTLGAHRIDFLEHIIRTFLDAEHLVRWSPPNPETAEPLRQARETLIRAARWKPPPPSPTRVRIVV